MLLVEMISEHRQEGERIASLRQELTADLLSGQPKAGKSLLAQALGSGRLPLSLSF